MATNLFEVEEAKRYLFGELPEDQSVKMEERFFSDNDLFYELMDLENELTDRYVADQLSADERQRFERSLLKMPERRAKVAVAASFQQLISAEKQPAAEQNVEQISWWKKLSNLFHISPMNLSYSVAGVLITLTAGSLAVLFVLHENSPRPGGYDSNSNMSREFNRATPIPSQTPSPTPRHTTNSNQNIRNQVGR